MKQIFTLIAILFLGLNTVYSQCNAPSPSSIQHQDNGFVKWSPVADVSGYVFQYRVNGQVTYTNVETTTNSFTIPNVEGCSFYDVRIRSKCNNGEISKPSKYRTITFNCTLCDTEKYCEVFGFSFNEYIARVAFNDYERISKEDLDGYYHDKETLTLLIPGETYDFELTPGYAGFNAPVKFSIYLDLNGNGTFDKKELIYYTPQGTTKKIVVPIEIPAYTPKISRLRIIMSLDFGQEYDDPCENGFLGEAEDYCVKRISECDEEFNLEYKGLVGNQASFSWEKLKGMWAFNYRYKKTSESEDMWTYYSTIDDNVALGDLDQCTEYEFEIRSVCAKDTSAYKYNTVFQSYCPNAVQNVFVQSLNTYPNPWSNGLSVQFQLDSGKDLMVVAYNSAGQSFVLSPEQYYGSGEHSIQLETNGQPMRNGMYVIGLVHKGNIVASKKTIKL